MKLVIVAPRGREGFLPGLCRVAAALLLALLALTAWPEAAPAQLFYVPIDGSPKVGNTLTANTDRIEVGVGQSLRYQWYAVADDDVVIEGATSQSYTIEEAQLGNRLTVRVGFLRWRRAFSCVRQSGHGRCAPAGTANQRPSGYLVVLNLGPWPAQSGEDRDDDPRVGDRLQERGENIEDPGRNGNLEAAGDDHLNFTWLADGVPVGIGVRGYRLTPADVGKRITLQLTFTDSAGVVETAMSHALGPVRWRVAATGQPTITGPYRVGDTLTAGTSEVNDPDGIDATTLTYEWLAGSTKTRTTMWRSRMRRALRTRSRRARRASASRCG